MGAFSTAHHAEPCICTQGMHRFALNDLSKRSLGAADLGIWSVLHFHLDFVGNSYTIWLTLSKFKSHSLPLILIFRYHHSRGQHAELLAYNQGIYLL